MPVFVHHPKGGFRTPSLRCIVCPRMLFVKTATTTSLLIDDRAMMSRYPDTKRKRHCFHMRR